MTSKGTYSRTVGGSGLVRRAYGARSALPELEDVGEATLTNGRAVMAIDAALANSIDVRRTYHVFVTPEGDCNQLWFFCVARTGNEVLSGTLTTSKGTYDRTIEKVGTKRVAFRTRSSSPEIEDVGQGWLTNGRAVVTIDAGFGDSVDMRRPYHVFITPEGDCNQLYVTEKTPNGFVVRESHGGRSSLAYDYRIVAKPADEDGERLAVDRERPTPPSASAGSAGSRARSGAPLARTTPHATRRYARLREGSCGAAVSTERTLVEPRRCVLSAKHMPNGLSVEDDLKRKLGPSGYAKALAELKKRIAAR